VVKGHSRTLAQDSTPTVGPSVVTSHRALTQPRSNADVSAVMPVQCRCLCAFRSVTLSFSVVVGDGAVTCHIRRWTPVVHRNRNIVITRFRLAPPGCRRALTLVGERGRVVYVYDWWGQHRRLAPALAAAGFVISPDEVQRWYPGVWR
jgi:hypothetical protein